MFTYVLKISPQDINSVLDYVHNLKTILLNLKQKISPLLYTIEIELTAILEHDIDFNLNREWSEFEKEWCWFDTINLKNKTCQSMLLDR